MECNVFKGYLQKNGATLLKLYSFSLEGNIPMDFFKQHEHSNNSDIFFFHPLLPFSSFPFLPFSSTPHFSFFSSISSSPSFFSFSFYIIWFSFFNAFYPTPAVLNGQVIFLSSICISSEYLFRRATTVSSNSSCNVVLDSTVGLMN